MKRFVAGIAALALGVSLMAAAAVALASWSIGPGPFVISLANDDVPGIDPSRPLTVVVRGWLWDPTSRRVTAPLQVFPQQVNEILQREHGLTTRIVQYDWSRLPKDIFSASDDFTSYARKLSEVAAVYGQCVNFVGHSVGAAVVYGAAVQGVRMGYMGTLGLPTFGTSKPPSVAVWGNFYTTTHERDLAGMLWASQMAADVNVDLQMPHRDFWGAKEVAETTADGIAGSWNRC
jgi:hypothetical protein